MRAGGVGFDLATLGVLWRRDVLLFLRQPSRLVGVLLTTLLLWLAIGAGIAPSFASPDARVGYLEYFYPGILLVLILQASITATMSVIEDRHQGFLQGVLVGPGSRSALALGKTLGAATVALLHAVLLVALAPLAGFSLRGISWIALFAFSALAALALTGGGFVLAWTVDSVQGYHAVMSLLLFPLWILSGAMFPAARLHPVLGAILRWNPMSYALSGLRRALYGGAPPAGIGLPGSSLGLDGLVVGTTTVLLLVAAAWVARRATERG